MRLEPALTRRDLVKARKAFYKMCQEKFGVPLTMGAKELVATIVNREFLGKRRTDLPRLIWERIETIPSLLNSLEGLSEGVDGTSKNLVDSLVKALAERHLDFRVTMQHLPMADYYKRISDDMEKFFKQLSKSSQVFFASFLFLSFYELSVELIFDLALEIAGKDADQVTANMRAAHQKRPYQREPLRIFLEKRGYFPPDGRGVLFGDWANFRDKIAHLQTYYSSDRGKLWFAGDYLDAGEIVEKFRQLSKFYNYLLFVSSQPLLTKIKELGGALRVT